MSLNNEKIDELVGKLREKSNRHLDNQEFKRKIVHLALKKRAKWDFRDMEILKAEAEKELSISSQ